MNFKCLHNFTIQGSGIVDGQGSNWWSTNNSQSKHIKVSVNIPTACLKLLRDQDMKEACVFIYIYIYVAAPDLSVMSVNLAEEIKAHSRYQTHSKIHLISSYW